MVADVFEPDPAGVIDRNGGRFPLWPQRPLARYFCAALLVGLAFAVRFLALGALPMGYPFATFLPAVVLAAFLFGARAAVVAMLLSILAGWWFFVGPQTSFAFGMEATFAIGVFVAASLLVIAVTDFLQTANRELTCQREVSRKLAENQTVLFLELQHRVGNNLQIVSSMLALQRREVNDPAAQTALDEAARRIGLIGRVQRQLYNPDGARIGLDGFFQRLVGDVMATSGREGIHTSVEVADGIGLRPEMAIPTALIFAEMLGNALEHGMAGRDGAVRVSVARIGDRLAIGVADDGHGLPAGFDLRAAQNLGLRLAGSLARFHGGALTLEAADGWTQAVLTFPIAVTRD